MTNSNTKKQIKRYIRRKLYRFFSALNEIHFSFSRPVILGTAILLLLVICCFLPTTHSVAPETEGKLAASLSASIRTSIAQSSPADSNSIDVVALFLPKDFSEAESSDYFQQASLYSIYLTGTELSYLAESTVSFQNELDTTVLTLDGLQYSYHPLRLPLNRITKLSFSNQSEIDANRLYRVVGTKELFSLFRYLSYRSQGLMKIAPKDSTGALLSDYEIALTTADLQPITLAAISSFTAKMTETTAASTAEISVTRLGGFNLITLLKHPNQTTLYFVLLSLLFVLLLWFCVPRIKRVRLWIRIHAIRRRKRATHTASLRSSRKLSRHRSGISKRKVA